MRAVMLGTAAFVAWRAHAAGKRPVRVGSKSDTEGALLGALMIKVLDDAGIATEDHVGLGPTRIVRAALLAGAIDLYPEYTGNGGIFLGQRDDPVWRDRDAGYARIRDADAARGIVWLKPAPADNGWGVAVRRDTADSGLRSFDDFAAWARADRVRLACSAEFAVSPAALPAFEAVYGFQLRRASVIALAGGNTAATLRATAERISGVNAGMAYGTDGALAALDLALLDDPRRAQPVFAPAPVLRREVIETYPAIGDLLGPVFARLDAPTLRRLNAQIAVDGEAPARVAARWLSGAA